VVTAAAAIPPVGLAKQGSEAGIGSSRILKFGVNHFTDLPGLVAGLLDPHANASGGLASSLDGEEE
jgi:hypothetical protein